MRHDPEDTKADIVNTLKQLEARFGSSPSVKDVADEALVSPATAHKYLKQAVEEGLIAQRDGKFMSLEVARAFEKKGK
jgi:DNA-binding transcriptional regulator YhcF (GntR family)